MSELFVHSLERYGEQSCLVIPDKRTISYSGLIQEADEIASRLRRPDGRRLLVFVEGRNTPASIWSYVGCLRAGHVVHLIDPDKQIENAELIEAYKPNILIRCGLDDSSIEPLHDCPLALHPDLAILLSTSGSTGSRKLVKLSAGNIQSNTESIIEYLHLQPEDRAITSLKFHYSYGMSIVNTHLAVGGSLVLTERSVQEPEFWQAFESCAPTNFNGVPYSFQLLDKLRIDLGKFDALRFVTQAGGRLSADLVRKFARRGKEHHWRFYVMYGQTEASPRMSYLPPEFTERYADHIGIAVPGGHFFILDDQKQLIEDDGREGELVYSGPNVMMGYAVSSEELATEENLSHLYTGDLAVKNREGLFRITGRTARFVKLFGMRINLDDIELYLNGLDAPACVVGDDHEIVLFSEQALPRNGICARLSEKYGLPLSTFRWKTIETFPRLANSKIDYAALKAFAWSDDCGLSARKTHPVRYFLKATAAEFWSILSDRGQSWFSVEQIFRVHFPARAISADESFISLGGDSLLYVEMSLCLEKYLGALPNDWHLRTVHELQARHVW